MKNPASEATALAGRLTEIRRNFHRHPELSFQEHRTAGVVAGIFEKAGIEVRRGRREGIQKGSVTGPCHAEIHVRHTDKGKGPESCQSTWLNPRPWR